MSDANAQFKGFPVTWDEFHRHCKALAWRLADIGPFQGIIAVTRGGMVPAGIVARELGIHRVDTVCVSTYDHQDRREARLLKAPAEAGDGTGWLVVDDLVDTGTTTRVVRQLVPKAHYATIYAKPLGRPLVDTFITEFSQDTWIYFPWEVETPLPYARPVAERR